MTSYRIDYNCAECGVQAIIYNARVFVPHKDGCGLLAWLAQNYPALVVHIGRSSEESDNWS